MKIRIVLALVAALSFLAADAQQRWQQHVTYKMDVTLDHTTHRFSGKQVLTYTNNSPDALDRVYYHLYFNAFQPGSAMDVRSRTIDDPDPRVSDRISKLKPEEYGYLHAKTLTMDGKPVAFSESETILEVELTKAIAPGAKVVFEMTFEGQVPLQIRRSGRDNAEGIDYSMSQWYPKMCAYDCHGWHPNPYIGREFYGEWGDFEVNITMDKSYTIGATGVLQNPSEIGKGFIEESKVKQAPGSTLTWKWKAENVHDFVWGADPDFVHTQKQVPNGPLLHFFYQNDPAYADNWVKLEDFTSRAFVFLSEHFGAYPYPQYSVIQGGDGGMEYPMATLITGNRKLPSLVGVTVHEAAHSWYQGVLATNEALYPWMDEGFTSYASNETMNHLFASGMPRDHSGAYAGYFDIVREGKEEALDTHADHYITNYAYGTASYNKGEVYLAQLEYLIGAEILDRALLRYFDTWKFRHPTDEDFLHIMELESGMVLDWYNEYFVHSTKTIDYAIVSVSGEEKATEITLRRKGLMPMPVDLEIEFTDGTLAMYYIPLDLMRGEKSAEGYRGQWNVMPDWKWVDPVYTIRLDKPVKNIRRIQIDPSDKMADTDRSNNLLVPAEGVQFLLKSE